MYVVSGFSRTVGRFRSSREVRLKADTTYIRSTAQGSGGRTGSILSAMSATVLTAGIACIIAAIVGGARRTGRARLVGPSGVEHRDFDGERLESASDNRRDDARDTGRENGG